MLGKVVKESQRDWNEKLPVVMSAYRTAPHRSMGLSPNRLFLGRETRMPIDLVMGLRPEEAVSLQTTDDYMIKLQEKLAYSQTTHLYWIEVKLGWMAMAHPNCNSDLKRPNRPRRV